MDEIYLLLTLGSIVCFGIGLFKPTLFSRILGDDVTRQRTSIVFFLIAFVTFVLFGSTTDNSKSAEQIGTSKQLSTEDKTASISEAVSGSNVAPAEAAPVVEEVKKPEEKYLVVSVVDGDTIKVNINGETETLRLIGMDTPETADPRTPIQCFGREASDKAKAVLAGKKVRLEADPTQGELDKYNRLLRYVFFEDGTLYNKMMIEEGYAHEYTYNTPYKYQSEFKDAETNARAGKKGFWGSICEGNTEQSAASAEGSGKTPAPALVAPVAPKASSGYTCNCSKTCANMSSCAEAQYQLNSCGCSARDADDDGIACDSDCQ